MDEISVFVGPLGPLKLSCQLLRARSQFFQDLFEERTAAVSRSTGAAVHEADSPTLAAPLKAASPTLAASVEADQPTVATPLDAESRTLAAPLKADQSTVTPPLETDRPTGVAPGPRPIYWRSTAERLPTYWRTAGPRPDYWRSTWNPTSRLAHCWTPTNLLAQHLDPNQPTDAALLDPDQPTGTAPLVANRPTGTAPLRVDQPTDAVSQIAASHPSVTIPQGADHEACLEFLRWIGSNESLPSPPKSVPTLTMLRYCSLFEVPLQLWVYVGDRFDLPPVYSQPTPADKFVWTQQVVPFSVMKAMVWRVQSMLEAITYVCAWFNGRSILTKLPSEPPRYSRSFFPTQNLLSQLVERPTPPEFDFFRGETDVPRPKNLEEKVFKCVAVLKQRVDNFPPGISLIPSPSFLVRCLRAFRSLPEGE